MKWVVDCSFAAALFLPDETSGRVRDFFSGLSEEDELVVPALWRYELGIKHHLTSYDAAYLALAMRIDAGLATLDKKLLKAAKACKLITY
ncbi:MAG: hypothetical protein D6814_09080 [Calditrichaeota bacterium]|nr:MAG: hypothetical protein D6814_09080 [Calditrichota bacterium]